jgi:hypothetical protein
VALYFLEEDAFGTILKVLGCKVGQEPFTKIGIPHQLLKNDGFDSVGGH